MVDRLAACGASGEKAQITSSPKLAPAGFALGFAYGDRRHFKWTANMAAGRSTFHADFGSGRTSMPATVSLLAQENALSEAMFF